MHVKNLHLDLHLVFNWYTEAYLEPNRTSTMDLDLLYENS